MTDNQYVIYVYSDWGNGPLTLIGKLYIDGGRGRELISFEYNREWLHSTTNLNIDPDLHLYEGRQYMPPGKMLFGVFSDSCPDRWGRLLMNRREAILARKEGRKARALRESDYLLGVFDETRMGALRFALREGGPFQSENEFLPVPPWTSIRTLEYASLAFENNEGRDDEKWLNQLFAPGSSLGGARPKASVRAPDNSLWIAKFPSKNDAWDVGAWEVVAHDLAGKCGLNVPEAKLEYYSSKGGTYLVKRFDRNGARRIHYTSAMTLLGMTDGAGSDGASYLDIVSFIKANGASPKRDLKELWMRVVFNMAISNTDDHLRNHGFLLAESGWTLSPMFDVNPNIYGDALSLNVSEYDNAIDFDLAIETARYYDIDTHNAKIIAENIKDIVSANWRRLASSYGLGSGAINYMAPAFAMAN